MDQVRTIKDGEEPVSSAKIRICIPVIVVIGNKTILNEEKDRLKKNTEKVSVR